MRIVTASKYESDSCYPEIYFIALHAAFQIDQRYDLIILYSKGQKLVYCLFGNPMLIESALCLYKECYFAPA